MQKIITAFVEDESGATAIEYGLIAAIVGIGIIVGLGQVRDGLNGLFQNVQAGGFRSRNHSVALLNDGGDAVALRSPLGMPVLHLHYRIERTGEASAR